MVENLDKEIKRIEENIFVAKNLTDSEKKARRLLIAGGILSSILSGGAATAVSTVVSLAAVKVIGTPTIAVCAVCGAIAGAGFGAWSAIEFGELFHEKHPGFAGATLAVVITGIAAPLAMGVYAAKGAIMGLGTGFLMAQAVGFGAFKASLIVLEPLAQYSVGKGFVHLAEQQLSESDKDKKEQFKKLKDFCEKPLSYSAAYWYYNLFNPPIHDDLLPLLDPELWLLKKAAEKDLKEIQKTVNDPNNNLFNKIWGKFDEVKSKSQNLGLDGLIKETEQIITKQQGFLEQNESSGKPPEQPKPAVSGGVSKAVRNAFRQLTGSQQVATEEQATEAFGKIEETAKKGEFENAAQAWANFDRVKGKFRSFMEKNEIERISGVILSNYGKRPGTLEILTGGLYSKERLDELKRLMESSIRS